MQEYKPQLGFTAHAVGSVERVKGVGVQCLVGAIILLGSLAMSFLVLQVCYSIDEFLIFGVALVFVAFSSFGAFFWRRWKQLPWEKTDRRLCLLFAGTAGVYSFVILFGIMAYQNGLEFAAYLALDYRLCWVATTLFLFLLYEANRKVSGQTERPSFWAKND